MFDIKEFRKKHKLTQIKIADILGCGQANISAMERTMRDLEEDQFHKLAEIFGGDEVGKYIINNDDNTNQSSITPSKGIPYYDVDVTMGYDELPNDQTNIPNYYLHIPAFQNCDCAVPAYGRSMIPDINDGSIIAIKEVSLDSVLPGEAYLIITDEYRTVKYIRNCKDNPNKWRLVPKNLEEFDEMIIDKAKVRRVFLVKGVITNKIL